MTTSNPARPSRRPARWIALVAVVAASTQAAPPSASAAPVSATATAVTPGPNTNCGDNPSVLIDGVGEGDGFGADQWSTEAGDPTPTVALDFSELYDDWSFTGTDFGFPFPAASPAGTVRGLYAVVGGADLDPATTAEWFLLYECGVAGEESVVLQQCIGPLGSCPRSVDEALAPEPEPEPTTSTSAPSPTTAVPPGPAAPAVPRAAAPAATAAAPVTARPGYTG